MTGGVPWLQILLVDAWRFVADLRSHRLSKVAFRSSLLHFCRYLLRIVAISDVFLCDSISWQPVSSLSVFPPHWLTFSRENLSASIAAIRQWPNTNRAVSSTHTA